MIIVESVGQAVVDHRVDQADIAHLATATQILRMGGERHAFLPTRNHDVGVARTDRLSRQGDSAQAGAAQLVDADGGPLDRDARIDGGLPRRVLALACAQHLAQDHFVHFLWRDTGLRQGGEDRLTTQFMRRGRSESAHEAADCGALGGGNHDV